MRVLSRRAVMKSAAAAIAGQALAPLKALANAPLIVNDITLLNPVRVAEIAAPRDSGDIQKLLGDWQHYWTERYAPHTTGSKVCEPL